jgi:hypothetical protein
MTRAGYQCPLLRGKERPADVRGFRSVFNPERTLALRYDISLIVRFERYEVLV